MKQNILVLSITVFLHDTMLSSWFMVFPLYLDMLGATTIDIGVSYALISLAWYALQFLGGVLADRYGRKMLIVLPTFMFPLCYITVSNTQTWSIAALAIVSLWAFSGLQSPSFTSMIGESVAERQRGMAFAICVFFVNLGWAVGPLIGAFVIPVYGFYLMFYICAIVSVFCGVIRFVLLRETLQKNSKDQRKMTFPVVNKNLMCFLAGCFLFAIAYGLVSPLLALYAERRLELSLAEIQLMFSIAQFATCLTSIPCGKLVERASSKYSLMVAFLGVCLSLSVWAYSPSLWAAIIVMAICSIFLYNLYDVAYGSLSCSLTSPEIRGTVLGIAGAMVGLFTAIGSAMGSYLWEHFDPILPFLITGILGFPSAMLLLRVELDSHK